MTSLRTLPSPGCLHSSRCPRGRTLPLTTAAGRSPGQAVRCPEKGNEVKMVGSAWPRHLLQCALSCEARHVRGALWGRLHGQGTPTAGCASRFVWLQEARCPRASPDSPPAAAPGPVSRLTPSTGPSGPPSPPGTHRNPRGPQAAAEAFAACACPGPHPHQLRGDVGASRARSALSSPGGIPAGVRSAWVCERAGEALCWTADWVC